MSEYNEKSKDYGSVVKPSRSINSIGGKKGKNGESIIFSPTLDDTSQTIIIINTNLPPYSFSFSFIPQSFIAIH